MNARIRASGVACIRIGWPLRRHQREQSPRQRDRQRDAQHAADTREHQALDQHLPHDAGRATRRATRRTAISFCRMKPRAISRLATLAQAISRTRPTMHISTISARREIVAQPRVADRRRRVDQQLSLHELLARVRRPVLRAGQRHFLGADLHEESLQRRRAPTSRSSPASAARTPAPSARARIVHVHPAPLRHDRPASSAPARGSAASAPDRCRRNPAAETPTIVIG